MQVPANLVDFLRSAKLPGLTARLNCGRDPTSNIIPIMQIIIIDEIAVSVFIKYRQGELEYLQTFRTGFHLYIDGQTSRLFPSNGQVRLHEL